MQRKILAILSIVVVGLAGIAFTTVAYAGWGNAGTIYTIDNSASGNNVLYYSRTAGGSITFQGSVAANGLGTGNGLGSQGAVVITDNGRFLLVVNAGSNEISVFAVQNNGPNYLSKTSSHGDMPISLTSYNNLVYVLNAGTAPNIAGFTLSKSGILTFISGSDQPLSGLTDPSPEQIGFSPDGKVIVVTEKNTNTIDTYTINKNGVASAPTNHPSNGDAPYGFAFTDKDKLVLSEAASNTMSSYVVSNQGDLRTTSGAMPTFGAAPCWVAIDNQGDFAYETNAHVGTISIFSISRSGGITLHSAIAAKVDIPALDLAFSLNSQFLYVLNGNSITGFKVYNDGSLSQVTSINTLPSSTSGLAAT